MSRPKTTPEPLYARCNLCDGTLKTVRPATVDGYRFPAVADRPYSGPLPAGSPCPCTQSATPGFAEIGLTLGQVERIKERADRYTEGFRDLDARLQDATPDTAVAVLVEWFNDYLWIGPLPRGLVLAGIDRREPGSLQLSPADVLARSDRYRRMILCAFMALRACRRFHADAELVRNTSEVAVNEMEREMRGEPTLAHVGRPDPLDAQEGHDHHPAATVTDGTPAVPTGEFRPPRPGEPSLRSRYAGALPDVPVVVVRGPRLGSAEPQPVPEGLAEGRAIEAPDGGPAGGLRDDRGRPPG